jgi:tryptophan synthase beta chain
MVFIEDQATDKYSYLIRVMFSRSEGIVPAPESSHAIRAAIDEAIAAREAGQEKVILFNLSGHGYFDFTAYDNYFNNRLDDIEYSEEAVEKSIKNLPKVEEE